MVFRLPPNIIRQLRDPDNLGQPFMKPLTAAGDGTGSPNMVGVFTPGAPGIFYLQPPANEIYSIQLMLVAISSNTPLRLLEYGSIPAIANGVTFIMRQDGVDYHIEPGGAPITNNESWLYLTSEPRVVSTFQEYNVLQFRIDFGDALDTDIILNGATADTLAIGITDDVSSLSKHNLMCQGFIKGLI